MDSERAKICETLQARHGNRAKHYKALILAERDRLLGMLNRLESEEAEPQSASGGDAVRGLEQMADAASDTLEQESDLASANRLSAHLAELDEALDVLLVAPHLFGFCRDCGEAIDSPRLALLPWALTCSACVRRGEETRVR